MPTQPNQNSILEKEVENFMELFFLLSHPIHRKDSHIHGLKLNHRTGVEWFFD